MEIIEADDLFGSYNGLAQFCGCSANTSKLFKTVAAKAEHGDWHVRELRHSAPTIVLDIDVPLEQVSKRLCH